MAYEVEEEGGQQQPAAAPAPALQAFKDAFTDPAAAQWAGNAVTRLNDYFTKRDLATANEQAGQNFVNDLGQFKNGLVGMVRADPHAVHTALDIVPETVHAMIASMPGMPEDAADHHAAVAGHMQSEIAAAAVKSMAERHEDSARALLDDPRINGVLGDAAGGLGSYIDLQAGARRADDAAAQERAQEAAARAADGSALNYLSALHNPAAGDVQFPAGWNQGVMADPNLPPAAKVGVSAIYNRLREGGDAPVSDPYRVADHIARISQGDPDHPADILSGVGDNLRLADALQLSHAAADPAAKPYFDQLNGVVQQAKAQLAPPENGPAGDAAFGRFVNWLLPAARAGGVVMDPADKNYVLGKLPAFAPKPSDLAGAAVGPVTTRPSLHVIFGNGGGIRADAALDDKSGRLHDMEMRRLQEEQGGSGEFFQRKLKEGGGAPIPLVPGPGESTA